jgi:hypothetical protein
VPDRVAKKSPGLTVEQQEFLAQRAVKHACHSDNVADEDEAKRVQQEYVKLGLGAIKG